MKADWEIKKLGEVCEIKCGATPLKSDKSFWENGTIPWFTVDDIRTQGRNITYTSKTVTEKALKKLTLFPSDTVMLCCTASVGEYAITSIPITSNQQFNGLIIKNKKEICPKYLFHFVSTLKEKLLSVSGKTTIDFVSNSKVCAIEIPVPPLPEQKRIVEILDQKFAQIEALKNNAQNNLQNAKDLFQAELTQAFSNDTWEKKRMGEIIDLLSGQDFPPEKYNSEQDGIPYITGASNFNVDGSILINRWTTVPSVIAKKLDILLVVKGSGYGKTTIADFDEAHIARQIMALRVKNELQREFLFFFLNSKFSEIKKMGNGVIPGITRSDVLDIEIPLPPLAEQQKIVAHLDALQEKVRQLEEIYTKQIANCDELKQSFLKKAFEGEL